MLAVITCATQRYQFALHEHARAIRQNVFTAGIEGGHFILVTCLKPVPGLLAHYRALLGDGWQIHHLPLPVTDGKTNYQQEAQTLIAQLFTAGFDKARSLGADMVWTLESDVLPEANCLRSMRDMLNFDGGFYDVAFCPYVSQGGGGVMGGRGTPQNWILPGIYDDERQLSPELEQKLIEHRAKLVPGEQPAQEWITAAQELEKEMRNSPPIGNIFARNAKAWRKRGWLEDAFPGIGKGAVVPSDWMPMGCNLFSKRATELVDFLGYEGKGTQDLYLGFIRLKQHGLRFCVIPHAVAHHVTRKDGGYVLQMLSHELSGEYEGHLRRREVSWISHEPGE
jgi:hypothetical protein